MTYIQTGNMNAGKPSLGAWISYGLGTLNENLPTFVVLNSKFNPAHNAQPISPKPVVRRLSPLAARRRGLRGAGDPVLYLSRPARRRSPDAARRCSTAWTSSTQFEHDAHRRPRDRDAHHAI